MQTMRLVQEDGSNNNKYLSPTVHTTAARTLSHNTSLWSFAIGCNSSLKGCLASEQGLSPVHRLLSLTVTPLPNPALPVVSRTLKSQRLQKGPGYGLCVIGAEKRLLIGYEYNLGITRVHCQGSKKASSTPGATNHPRLTGPGNQK